MRTPLMHAALLALLAACAAARAPTPATAPPLDVPDDVDEVVLDEAARPPEPAPLACPWRIDDGAVSGPEDFDDEPTVTWADLDGRPPQDALVDLGACGNWADCVFVLLEGCDDGGYRSAWGPEYAQGLTVAERDDGAARADLILHGRTGQAGCDLPLKTPLTWDGEGWQKGETCAGEGVWEVEYCGDPPPACADGG